MTLFFFDVDDGERRTFDDQGTEFPGLKEAREGAIRALPDVARDLLPDGDRRDFVVTVKDANGRALFRASLSFRSEWLNGEPAPDRA